MSRWPHTPDTAPGRLCREHDLDRRMAEHAEPLLGLPEAVYQREPDAGPPSVPWRALSAGCMVLLAVPLVLHLAVRFWPAVAMVATR